MYLLFMLGGLIVASVGQFVAAQSPDVATLGLSLALVGFAGMITAGILNYVYLYRAWACLQPGGASISPGKAIGFMFIPLFNIIWIFFAIGGLPKQWNEITSRYSNTQAAPRMSIGPFICLLLIPVIGQIIWIASVIKGINFMASAGKFTATSTTGGSGLNFGPTTIKGASSNLKFK